MNEGPIDKGTSYLAIIKISGEMDAESLKKTVKEINALLKPRGGKIVIESRVSNNASVTLKASYGPTKKS